ncbi:hypothetical protein CEXT_736581 [Caerostris extrusa]|uniref:Uncharacterized protein n=1 Tax=Caerostris extrusa TaxID=172846 RepID=A0AAV4V0K4_CAEEX|nr:hypothetical protein CEXT_736581 [Caerostris extrusa]
MADKKSPEAALLLHREYDSQVLFINDVIVVALANIHMQEYLLISTYCPPSTNIDDNLNIIQRTVSTEALPGPCWRASNHSHSKEFDEDLQNQDPYGRHTDWRQNPWGKELETDNSILAPWEKLKFRWRYLRPEEGGYCIFTDGSKKDDRQLRKPHTPSNSVKQEGQERSGGNYEDEATEDFRNNPRVVLEGSSHLIFSTA